jgi:peptidyl-prolyl cis-trans isomerase D
MIIPFALFGVDSLFLQDTTQGKAAEVNGEPITEMDLTRALQMQKQQLLSRFGEQIPADMISDEVLRTPVLERLLQRQLLKQKAEEGGMAVSDAALDQMIVATPQFQQDGRFSAQLYTQLLRTMGYTPASYKSQLVEDLLVNQHASALNASAFVTPGDMETLTALTQQSRSFYYLTLPYEKVAEGIEVSGEELNTHYDNNSAQYMSPEQVSIEYIELNLDDLADITDVDPAEVREQYQQEVESFEAGIQRQAAHILIEDGDNAETKIDEVQQKLNAGEDFTELAKTYSEDLGSSEFGGDLGMTDGSTFPEAFEQALASLEVGQVSGPIATDAGTHFIKLIAVEEVAPPSFEEAKGDIEANLALATAESRYLELLEELPDATYNAVSLEDAAESLGLNAVVSELFSRDGGTGITNNNQVLAAAFGDDVLNQGLASDVIELTDNHVIVIKLREHKPSAVKPFAEVETEIREALTRNKAAEILRQQAEQLAEKVKSGTDVETVAAEAGVEWQVKAGAKRSDLTVDRALLEHIFAQPKPADKPLITTLQLDSGDYVVAQLTVVAAGELPEMTPEQKRSIRQRLAQELGSGELGVYQAALKQAAQVEVY